MTAIHQDVSALNCVHNPTEELCLEAVRLDPFILQLIDEPSERVCLEAVRGDGRTLQWVEHQTQRICWEAVREDPKAFDYVKRKNERLALEFVKEEPYMVREFLHPTEEMKLIYQTRTMGTYQEIRQLIRLGKMDSNESLYGQVVLTKE